MASWISTGETLIGRMAPVPIGYARLACWICLCCSRTIRTCWYELGTWTSICWETCLICLAPIIWNGAWSACCQCWSYTISCCWYLLCTIRVVSCWAHWCSFTPIVADSACGTCLEIWSRTISSDSNKFLTARYSRLCHTNWDLWIPGIWIECAWSTWAINRRGQWTWKRSWYNWRTIWIWCCRVHANIVWGAPKVINCACCACSIWQRALWRYWC